MSSQQIDSTYVIVDLEELLQSNDILEFKEDDFKRIKELDSGAEGVVHLASHGTFGEVAIKSYSRRIPVHENKDIGSLMKIPKNKHIVTFFGLIRYPESNGIMSCVMEYMPNGSLHSVIYHSGFQYTDRTVYMWIKHVVKGLWHIHTQGYIHRDVKPKNILVGRDMTLKIGDFGHSRPNAGGNFSVEKGTPDYMAPEIITGQLYNEKVDIYSLSITIAEMFNKKKFFDPSIINFVVWQKVIAGVRPELVPELDQRVKNLLKKGWAQNPSERPALKDFLQTADELLRSKKQTASLVTNLLDRWGPKQPPVQEEKEEEELRDILEIRDIYGYLRDYSRAMGAAQCEKYLSKYVKNEESELNEVLFGDFPVQYKFALNMIKNKAKEGVRLYCFCFEKRIIPVLLYNNKNSQSIEPNPLQELIRKCMEEREKVRLTNRSISENISIKNVLLIGTNKAILTGFLSTAIRHYKESKKLLSIKENNEIFEEGTISCFDYFLDNWSENRNSHLIRQKILQLNHVYIICFLVDLDSYMETYSSFMPLKRNLIYCPGSNCIAIFYRSKTKDTEALNYINGNFDENLFGHFKSVRKKSPDSWTEIALKDTITFILQHVRNVNRLIFQGEPEMCLQ